MAVIPLAGAASAILAVGINQVAGLIDEARIFPDDDLGGSHAGVGACPSKTRRSAVRNCGCASASLFSSATNSPRAAAMP